MSSKNSYQMRQPPQGTTRSERPPIRPWQRRKEPETSFRSLPHSTPSNAAFNPTIRAAAALITSAPRTALPAIKSLYDMRNSTFRCEPVPGPILDIRSGSSAPLRCAQVSTGVSTRERGSRRPAAPTGPAVRPGLRHSRGRAPRRHGILRLIPHGRGKVATL